MSQNQTSTKATGGGDKEPDSRVFSIAPGAPFLKTLAEALVDGRLISGFVPKDDPLALASATIYLPTRRAARALAGEIIEAMGSKASLLPAIRTFGDADDSEADDEAASAISPPISALGQKLTLARLVRGWTSELARSTRELLGDEDIAIPSSAAEAIRLAADLSSLMESMDTEEIGWDSLALLVGEESAEGHPENWAQWWNLTLEFMGIVTRLWPVYLAENHLLGAAERRRQILDLRTQRLLRAGSAGPVIAAGSTGSIPATARLIKAICGLANGAVVLPGLDLNMDGDVWSGLGGPDAADQTLSLCTHPQYGLARLLRQINLPRQAIGVLGAAGNSARNRLIGDAMLPAAATGRWNALPGHGEAALAGVGLIEAPNERKEALAIAVALREVLETPQKSAALVTPDRVLARRVAVELGRFGIAIDDSGGTPLGLCAPAALARLVLHVCSQPPDPAVLAALFKHPGICGQGSAAAARHARLFELAVLRDAIVIPLPGGLAAAVRQARTGLQLQGHAPHAVKAMTPADWEAVEAVGQALDAAVQPLTAMRQSGEPLDIAHAMAALRLTLLKLFPGSAAAEFFAQHGGSQLLAVFDHFTAMANTGFAVAPLELCDVFDALLAGAPVREARLHHPRLAILGPLEARLQHYDRLVLGGLNEANWPAQTRSDPFLNRPMKAQIGLSTPERRTGQAAHDFQQLSGQGEVIYSRALRSQKAPTVASRWLQRLAVLAGESAAAAMRKTGKRYLDLAEMVDRSTSGQKRAARPNPKPAVELRPRRLSVTEIETWIRDPYAIHAKRILGLSPLPPLGRAADALLRGQLYHEILARFIAKPAPISGSSRLEAIAREVFAANNLPPEVSAVWLPRFLAIGRLFIDWEDGRRAMVHTSHCEIDGGATVGQSGFMLSGRADRIDEMIDGALAIFDYKTGTRPTPKEALNLSPQLALEAKMAQLGAFGISGGRRVGELAYVRLRIGENLKVDQVKSKEGFAALADNAWRELEQLINAFRDPERGYLSRHAPSREGDVSGDYDHLSRVREWSYGEDGDE